MMNQLSPQQLHKTQGCALTAPGSPPHRRSYISYSNASSPSSLSQLSYSPSNKDFPASHSSHSVNCIELETVRCISSRMAETIQKAERDGYIPPETYSVFNREGCTQAYFPESYGSDAIEFLFTIIQEETQMEYECVLIALIYLERLSISTYNDFRLCALNWRHALFTCMLLASKIWDDFSLSNAEFADVFTNMPLARLNKLESTALNMLHFDMMVLEDEYMELFNSIHEVVYIAKYRRYKKVDYISEELVEQTATDISGLTLRTTDDVDCLQEFYCHDKPSNHRVRVKPLNMTTLETSLHCYMPSKYTGDPKQQSESYTSKQKNRRNSITKGVAKILAGIASHFRPRKKSIGSVSDDGKVYVETSTTDVTNTSTVTSFVLS
eukprot:CAMPEP_0185033132 /NCGR_PEP_ID=MMETSP1103-20130426/21824_1 /TAXON_ID=36769 /ORGANISM="Paraphysomonas bandaiensis, Strain Caron Lab Isolate" /LENGTH=381 /DNA_ID=CAMNT_0027569295 /DNA_START=137 /DNA_END=1282 /DNA_ORIENTATION=-